VDPRHFDALSRALSGANSRRHLLTLLASLPVMGGLFGALEPEDANARRRGRRRKRQHQHGKGRRRRKNKKKQCTPESTAQTCAGKCGNVTNNCNKPVDCGSCACTPSCDACFVCQDQGTNAPGVCVIDPTQAGDACGDPGQVCQSDGSCVCVPNCDGKCGGAADGCGGTCTGTCATGLICIGQACVNPQGTCPTGADQCARTGNSCNGRSDCFCRITTEGDTRCGGNAIAGGGLNTCGECGSTADCLTKYPGIPGAFCLAGGTGCCNSTARAGNCVAPCPS
jgi:hypothetical protein